MLEATCNGLSACVSLTCGSPDVQSDDVKRWGKIIPETIKRDDRDSDKGDHVTYYPVQRDLGSVTECSFWENSLKGRDGEC